MYRLCILAGIFVIVQVTSGALVTDHVNVTVKDASVPGAYNYGPARERDGIVIGDVLVNPHRNAVRDPSRIWPQGQIFYVISRGYPTEVQATILTAMREIEYDVNEPGRNSAPCIQFVSRSTQRNYIEIYPGKGCHATVGLINNGRQSVSVGTGCEAKGVIMHELLHALGFWHEQNRYDRDSYIDIDLDNVDPEKQHDFVKATTSEITTQNIAYDFSSIMHYGAYTLAKNFSLPVITPKPGQARGVKLGQKLQLSDLDVLKIQRLYECKEDTSHITRTISADVVVSCNFEDGLCNLAEDNSSDFKWTRYAGANEAGPIAGSTNGADPYLLAKASTNKGMARILTPFHSKGSVCLDFFLYQTGPSSYLDLLAEGPRIPRVTIRTFRGENKRKWSQTRLDINVPHGAQFQILFEAHLDAGDVALDDINIYPGSCL